MPDLNWKYCEIGFYNYGIANYKFNHIVLKVNSIVAHLAKMYSG